MTRAARLTLMVLGLLTIGVSARSQQDPAAPAPTAPKSILWSRTWEGALREARIRHVPLYILVSIGEG